MDERVLRAIFSAIDDVNIQLAKDQQLEKSVGTVLFGQSGKLDSLGLINLIVTTEQKIEEEYGAVITLANESAMSQDNSPFRTIGTCAEYTASLLQKKTDE